MAKYGYGADIGGTTVKLALFTDAGDLLEKWEVPTVTADSGAAILPDIAAAINGNVEKRGLAKADVLGVGVGIPGPTHSDGTANAVNLGWENAPVVQVIGDLTGLAVKIENDANVAALGEMWMGSGRGARSLAMVTLGTGIGGGIIVDGRVLSGAHSAGGEIGHIPLVPTDPRPCNCGSHGCFEQFASANGNVRTALDCMAETDEPSPLRDIAPKELNSKILWEYALAGDRLANIIADRYCRYLGQGLATVANVVDPELILLGGGLSKVGQPLIDRVRPVYEEFAFPACKKTEIRIASLGNDAGTYGCMYMLL